MNNFTFNRTSAFFLRVRSFYKKKKNATFKVIFPLIEKYSVKYISISYMKWISSLEIDAYVMCVIQK